MGASPNTHSPAIVTPLPLPERGDTVARNGAPSPSPENAGDNKGSTYEECKSPMRVVKEWLPFCEEELKPTQGLEFANLDDCEKFYKSYAHHVGFSVRKLSFKKSKEDVQKYRWTKMASSKPIFNVNRTLLEGCSQMMHKDKLISNNWVEFLECMRIARRDPDKLTLVGKRIQNVVKELKELDGGTSERIISALESFVGSSVPERIDILPPKQCHTKGSGKRLKGGKEKSIEQQQKRQRLCKACGQQCYHDSRSGKCSKT
ncbi:hypothetical protein Cgig2_000391 [Carnegiea gigantea]|uniref:FAR1 domain-containing protein n=1 Tax=Carnegiea gigantea TaxID=171969 RepID=A0A9Q1K7N7_9CARY|nr:hypothetical protein Cgig2_000391 [Carnegiea gigantea]